MVQDKMLDCSEVASNESKSKPIEQLWGDLKTAVGRRHPSNLGELEQFAQEEWSKLPVESCQNLIHGYRKRLTAVILSKDRATKY